MKKEQRNGKFIKKYFLADGMTCPSCEKIISKTASRIKGVRLLKIDYSTQEGIVVFDPEKTSIDKVFERIEDKGYECSLINPNQKNKAINFKSVALGIVLIISIFAALSLSDNITGTDYMMPGEQASFALLFVLGFFTGLHCIGMCGGFVMSYTGSAISKSKRSLNTFSHVQYAFGKTASYTIFGAVFGFIGSVFVFTPMLRGIAGIIAGLFLIIYGVNVLNIFPPLRKIRIPVPKALSESRLNKSGKGKSPLIVGLLNGLMIACGPLQALYIYAAGTGSPIQGAMALFAFGLGTLPFLLGFGMFTSFISKSMAHNILKISGIIVVVLGVMMLNQGLSLTGTGYDFNSMITYASFATADAASEKSQAVTINSGYQEIRMDVTRRGWEPDKFVLKRGVPVKWIINGKEINGCNNAINVPAYNLEFDIKPGEQVIEFTPDKEGVISWSCWMGMIPGAFIVKDDINMNDEKAVKKEIESVPLPKAGRCGCGGGR